MGLEFKELKKIPLFSGIDETDLNAMVYCINPLVREFSKGDTAAHMYDPISGVGVVLSGEVEVKRENAAGSRLILAFLEKGDTFGEMAAFSGSRLWPATVTARTDCSLMLIPPEKFLGGCSRSCAAHRTLIQNMLRIISGKALALNRKVEYLGIKSMRGKICTYLLEQYRINKNSTFVLPMNRNELADYLGVSRPSMSREFGRLKDEGVIDFYLSSVRILDMENLKKCAE
jgi:CRP/FNR family transcriptional regulator, dissimilatory nitrate respiration regulator